MYFLSQKPVRIYYLKTYLLQEGHSFMIFPYTSTFEGWRFQTEWPVAKFYPKFKGAENNPDLKADKPVKAETTFTAN